MTKKSHNSRHIQLSGVAQSVTQKEPEAMQYLELRNSIYWFKRRAPKPLPAGAQIVLGDREVAVHANGYVRFSLQLREPRHAQREARKYAYLLDEAAARWKETLQRSVRELADTEPTPDDIAYAAEAMFSKLLAIDEAQNQKVMHALLGGHEALGKDERELADAEVENESGELRDSDRFQWSASDLPPPSAKGQVELLTKFAPLFSQELYFSTGKVMTSLEPKYLPFVDAFRRYVSALEKRKAAEVVVTPPMPLKPWGWDDAFNYYFDQRKGLAQGTKDNYRVAWESISRIVKKPPKQLEKADVIGWRDELLKELDPKTVLDRLRAIKAIWNSSQDSGKIPDSTADPFKKVTVTLTRNKPKARVQFNPEELRTLFAHAPVSTSSAVSAHAGYWIPILALYHGSRLEELTGLEVEDLEPNSEFGLILHIRINTTRPSLKNMHKSERSVPLHPKLIELGFGDYVQAAREAKIERLFPSYARGSTFGEAYSKHAKLLLPEKEGLIGMHCFRHTWESVKRNKALHEASANYITGRAFEDGSSSGYGEPPTWPRLHEELSKIQYEGLTFLPPPVATAEELRAQDAARVKATRAKTSQRKDVLALRRR